MKNQVWIAIAAGLAIFAAVFAIRLLITNIAPGMPAFYRQLTLEILMGVLSVAAAVLVFNIPLANFSLTDNFDRKVTFRYSKYVFALGILVTAVILAFKMPAIPILKDYNLAQYLIIMLAGSVSEEMLARGLVQGIVTKQKPYLRIGGADISGGVLAGAVVFSLIHISVYLSGGSIVTCITIMLSAFFIGIAAGLARERANLGSAIVTHLFFNIGGTIAGILINIGFMAVTGHLINAG